MRESKRIRKGLMTILFVVAFFIYLFTFIGIASADHWAITYGGSGNDGGGFIQQTSDGGYIMAGATNSFGAGGNDIWVLKLDDNGNVLWQKTYGGGGDDGASLIQQTSDGGYIMAGLTNSFGAGGNDIWVLKLDGNGDVLWQKTYGGSGGEVARSIQQTSDGGYVVGGFTDSFSAGDFDLWVLKLDGDGDVLWQKTYGGSDSTEWIGPIQQTSDGGYIMAGAIAGSFTNNTDVWVLKLDTNGNVLWQKTYGGTNNEVAWITQQTPDGGYIVGGWTDPPGAGDRDLWVLKLDTIGNVLWQKAYGGSGNEEWAESIRQTSDGGYIIGGTTASFGAGGMDIWVLKLDGNGGIPGCGIVKTSNAIVNNTSRLINNTTVIGINSSVSPQTSTAILTDTNATVIKICSYYGPITCSITPSGATHLSRGSNLKFSAAAQNNTDQVQVFQFVTRITLPNWNTYPSSGYLVGPLTVTLNPHESKSKNLTQWIPYNAPFGTYAYRGYVGMISPPLLYNKCQSTFSVNP